MMFFRFFHVALKCGIPLVFLNVGRIWGLELMQSNVGNGKYFPINVYSMKYLCDHAECFRD